MIDIEDRFTGDRVFLRLVTENDCGEEYISWLNDPMVNRYLETRFSDHDETAIREFVRRQLADVTSWLFAIIVNETGRHVGNIKIGPVNSHHRCADISFFIGDRSYWGKGLVTEAIGLATGIGFDCLDLNRCQAGVYANNIASSKALLRNGYREEACFRKALRGPEAWEDHLWYGILVDEWRQR